MNQRATRIPKQARSIGKVASILDATIELLSEDGYEGLNTNAVARKAKINISTLYSYFRNKEAILEILLERYNEQLIAQLQERLESNSDKSERVGVIISAQVEQMINEPWIGAFKKALATAPALQELQTRANQHLINSVIAQIPQDLAGPKVSGQHQQVVMLLLVGVQNYGTQLIANTPPSSRSAMLEEVTLLINSYLDNYR
jgi:AcrR family transcriptional regulator